MSLEINLHLRNLNYRQGHKSIHHLPQFSPILFITTIIIIFCGKNTKHKVYSPSKNLVYNTVLLGIGT